MRHNQEDENRVNTTLISLARKHEENSSYNILLYIKKCQRTYIIVFVMVKNKRLTYRSWSGLPNQEYYFKTGDEMKHLYGLA
jgi:DNA polymerase-3 subunit alpha